LAELCGNLGLSIHLSLIISRLAPFLPGRRCVITAISGQNSEAMATGSTGISLILPQAEDQPSLSALRASLEYLLQGLFPLLAVFFLMHDLFSMNARAARCETKFSSLTIDKYNRRAISGDDKAVRARSGGHSCIIAQSIIVLCGNLGLGFG
jgi:hypothetical protein